MAFPASAHSTNHNDCKEIKTHKRRETFKMSEKHKTRKQRNMKIITIENATSFRLSVLS